MRIFALKSIRWELGQIKYLFGRTVRGAELRIDGRKYNDPLARFNAIRDRPNSAVRIKRSRAVNNTLTRDCPNRFVRCANRKSFSVAGLPS